MEIEQEQLWCGCGGPIWRAGLCARCHRRARLNRENFDGRRDAVLARDGFACVLCGATENLVVHHRNKVRLVTLCRGEHASVHHRRRLPFGVPDLYAQLWREQHAHQAQQLELPLLVVEPTIEQIALFGETTA